MSASEDHSSDNAQNSDTSELESRDDDNQDSIADKFGENDKSAPEDLQEKAFFSPPLSVQRYDFVYDLVQKYKCKAILDLGCGECRLVRKLKNLDFVERVTGVDIDRTSLMMSRCRCRPLTSDYLRPRSRPLQMELYEGDLTKPDARIFSHDMAVMIEVVEHLHDETLANLPNAVFGILNPKYVVMTTPNSEYNVLFDNFQGLRHWDHKFEWNRQEFEEWCGKVGERFGYEVEYTGVGEPPENQDVGFCTQIAIFTRKDNFEHKIPESDQDMNTYNQICSEKHPFRTRQQILTENVCLAVEKALPKLVENDTFCRVPLTTLYDMADLSSICCQTDFAELLKCAYYKLSPDMEYLYLDLRENRYESDEDEGGQFDDAEGDFSRELFIPQRDNSYVEESWD